MQTKRNLRRRNTYLNLRKLGFSVELATKYKDHSKANLKPIIMEFLSIREQETENILRYFDND